MEGFHFGLLFVLLFAGVLETTGAQSTSDAFVQATVNTTSAAASSSSLSFSKGTGPGDLMLVGFDYDTNATPSLVAVALSATNVGGTSKPNLSQSILNVAAPAITSNTSASNTAGHAFSYQIIASNAPTSFSASGLPSGLSVNTSTGLISGVAGSTGTWTATISATNSGGTGTSNLALNISAVAVAPKITSQPASVTVTAGQSATFSVNASGTTPFRYQWEKNRTAISGATSASYTTPQTTTSQNGAEFCVVVSNSAGSVTSNMARLAVVASTSTPAIVTQPSNVAVNKGQTATFTVTASGAAPLGYQWKKNGSNISGATAVSYTTPANATSDNGSRFDVVVSNSAGSVTSNSATLTVKTAQGQFVALSSNGKYLVNESSGQPVFLVAEQAFDLDQNLSNSELETYLSDRSSKGFNLIWMAVVDNSYSANPPLDSQGNAPFTGSDFTNMNSAYFAHLDYVLNRMATYGISALLGPAFSGSPCTTNPPINPSGYCHSMENTSDATLTAYGQYLGNRYESFPNIIWLIGGDMDSSSNLVQKHNDIATGIRSADKVHLMTAQNIRGQSTLDVWTSYPWIRPNGINSIYSLPANIPSMTNSNYTRKDFLPEFLVEDWCENEHGETPLGLRTEGYWAVLSGAYLGRQFCNYPIWALASGWQAHLSSLGSVSQSLLAKLFRSREHWLLVPDMAHSVVTAGYGSGSTLTTTARTSDGRSIISYIPNGHAATITVNMAKITSSTNTVRGWWYDPQTGATVDLGTFANSGTRTFTPPDTNDWVLVLDDEAAQLPAPGAS